MAAQVGSTATDCPARRTTRVMDGQRRDQDAAGLVAARTEERIAVAIAGVSCAMAVLVIVPLAPWLPGSRGRMDSPADALVVAMVAAAEVAWVIYRVRRTGTTRDPWLLGVDVVVALALMLWISFAFEPARRSEGRTPYFSFTLVAAGLAGLGSRRAVLGLAAPVALAVGWAAPVWPQVTMKLVQDCLGYLLWYGSCAFIGREFRRMAMLADDAQAAARAAELDAAEERRLAAVARVWDQTHQEIHDRLLPIVDAVAGGRIDGPRLVDSARQAAHHARMMLQNTNNLPPGTLIDQLAKVRDAYVAAGLDLTAIFEIDADPPPPVATAIAAAVGEALNNTRKYAGNLTEVTLYAAATSERVTVTVRDHGVGFDVGAVRPGGGLGRTFPALRRLGGAVQVTSTIGEGTKVIMSWPAGPVAGGRSGS
ncbi:MAG: ATP-binding protein [Dehalococcoidia bacterium]